MGNRPQIASESSLESYLSLNVLLSWTTFASGRRMRVAIGMEILLIVETSNFVGNRRLKHLRYTGTTKDLQLVERLARIDVETLEYEFTVTDPETQTRP